MLNLDFEERKSIRLATNLNKHIKIIVTNVHKCPRHATRESRDIDI